MAMMGSVGLWMKYDWWMWRPAGLRKVSFSLQSYQPSAGIRQRALRRAWRQRRFVGDVFAAGNEGVAPRCGLLLPDGDQAPAGGQQFELTTFVQDWHGRGRGDIVAGLQRAEAYVRRCANNVRWRPLRG